MTNSSYLTSRVNRVPAMPGHSTLRHAHTPTNPNNLGRQRGGRSHIRLVSSGEFDTLAVTIIGAANPNTKKFRHRFRAAFGLPAFLVAHVWRDLVQEGWLNHLGPRSLRPVHLLWALHFLKCYSKESINGCKVGCDEKTFRKWAWFCVESIGSLEDECASVPLCSCSALLVIDSDSTQLK